MQICYTSQNNQPPFRGASDGDFGGPIVHKTKPHERALCLIGIASFSGLPSYMVPNVFTNVGYLQQWIDDAIHFTNPEIDFQESVCQIL